MSKDDIIKPDVSLDYANNFVIEVYGIKVITIKEANSYDDRNFIVRDCDDRQYVLKVSNIEETDHPFRLDFQNNILTHLSDAGLPVQKLLRSVNGNSIERKMIETRVNRKGDKAERIHGFRLLSFIPGIRVDDNEVVADSELLYDIGSMVGKIDKILTKSLENVPAPEIGIYSLLNASRLKDFVYACKSEEQRKLILESVRRYETEVLPITGDLTEGIIHGDPNEQNILVQEEAGSFKISGILDWQDSHRCAIVFDLAMLCMYMTFAYKPNWKVDEFSLSQYCIRGFNSVWNLSQKELHVLPTLVITRYAQSLCLGAYSYYELDPTNDYLLTTAQRGWRQLQILCSMETDKILNMWLGGK